MTDTMQFRDYLFPQNPQRITVTRGEGTVTHFCPGKGEVVQRMGGNVRLVHCEGCFFADTFRQAAAQLAEFQQKTADGQAGTLFLPGVSPFRAYLREFVFEASGDGRIIPYTMRFVEAEVGG